MVDPFEYIPPNEITGPKHTEINAAHKACSDTFGHVLTGAPWLGEHAGHYDPQVAHDSITGAARTFFRTVQTYAPPSADRAAAERCVRLARMHANEAIRAPIPADAADSIRRAFDALADARLQANAAIALESAQTSTQREPAQVGGATDADLLRLLGDIGHAVAMGHCRDAGHALRQLRADPKGPAQLLERVRALELHSRGGVVTPTPAQVAP